MGASIRASLPVNEGDHDMTTGERRYSDHDLKTAERLGGVEALLRDHILPALERIEENCRVNRCLAQPVEHPREPGEKPETFSSSAWFWGKVAGGVAVIAGGLTTLGVAVVNKAPEILASIGAFFNPPKHP